MSARLLLLWSFGVFLALSGGMMLVEEDARVDTLESGLGPKVETRALQSL